MDTPLTDEPVGGEGATSSQDTSEVGTQTAETPEVVSANESAEAGTPESPKILGKYNSYEDLEKAHKELEGKLGELGQKASAADLLQEKYGITPDQLRERIEAQELALQEQQYQENPGAFAVQQVNELKAELALRDEQQELDSFIQKNPEYASQRDKLLKLGLNLERDKTYEEIATEYFGATRAQGQQDAYKKIDTKVRTQTTASQSAPGKKFTAEDMSKMSVAELEQILPHADTSGRPY